MVSGLLSSVEGSLLKATPNFHTYADFFNKVFPFYLSMGMSYDEFWEYDCQLVKAYDESYKQRMRDNNFLAWLNGRYVFEAVGAVIGSSFGKKSVKYVEHPYDLFAEDQDIREEQTMRKNGNIIFENLKVMQKQRDERKKK